MRVVDSKEMKEIERISFEELGLTESLIIENVGRSAAFFIEDSILDDSFSGEIVFLIGKGNNGADGLATARHLTNQGYRCRAFILFSEDELNKEVQYQIKLALSYGVKVTDIRDTESIDSYFSQTQGQYIVVDAILGIGFRPPLSNYLFDLVNIVNSYADVLISLDIPTGVSCDTGLVSGNSIHADFTLTIALPKIGLYIGDGAKYSGEIVVLDSGFSHKLLTGGEKSLLTYDELSVLLERDRFGHKNSFGHCLIVGGSAGLTGALILSARGALKAGTGLVTASTWDENYHELCSRMTPEIMTGYIPTAKADVDTIVKRLKKWDSIVVGPGLGRSEKSRNTVLELLNHFAGPIVVDADAIWVLNLKEDLEMLKSRKWPTIFTPHIGEFAGFLGKSQEEIVESPLKHLKETVETTNCCFILKGPCTYLGFPNGEIGINYLPNDGMATAGSGDVLAGILGGLLAQYPMEKKSSRLFADASIVYDVAKSSVCIHSLAGKYACEKVGARGMSALDIVDHLKEAFSKLSEN